MKVDNQTYTTNHCVCCITTDNSKRPVRHKCVASLTFVQFLKRRTKYCSLTLTDEALAKSSNHFGQLNMKYARFLSQDFPKFISSELFFKEVFHAGTLCSRKMQIFLNLVLHYQLNREKGSCIPFCLKGAGTKWQLCHKLHIHRFVSLYIQLLYTLCLWR